MKIVKCTINYFFYKILKLINKYKFHIEYIIHDQINFHMVNHLNKLNFKNKSNGYTNSR